MSFNVAYGMILPSSFYKKIVPLTNYLFGLVRVSADLALYIFGTTDSK